MLSNKIINFCFGQQFDESLLPDKISVMNPYENSQNSPVGRIVKEFYEKFYSDEKPRKLILGINPGRFGAGLTGIPFTDTIRLRDNCGIDFSQFETRETSSVFVYEMIEAFGGTEKFYSKYFIGAVSPLGFLREKENGKKVNYNYYDSREMFESVRKYILESLEAQIRLCSDNSVAFCLGTGKNFQFLSQINDEQNYFEKIIPLEHPRYIMQYKMKSKNDYIEKYLRNLKK